MLVSCRRRMRYRMGTSEDFHHKTVAPARICAGQIHLFRHNKRCRERAILKSNHLTLKIGYNGIKHKQLNVFDTIKQC